MHPFFSVTLFTGQQLVLEALQRWLQRPCPDAVSQARRRMGLKQLIGLLLRTAATGVLATLLDAAIEFRRRQLLAAAAADPAAADGADGLASPARFPGLGMLSRAGVAAWKSRLLLAIDELERRAGAYGIESRHRFSPGKDEAAAGKAPALAPRPPASSCLDLASAGAEEEERSQRLGRTVEQLRELVQKDDAESQRRLDQEVGSLVDLILGTATTSTASTAAATTAAAPAAGAARSRSVPAALDGLWAASEVRRRSADCAASGSRGGSSGSSGQEPGSSGASSCADDVCAICMDRAVNVQVAGCSHDLCFGCARRLCASHDHLVPQCPFCRQAINGFVPIGAAATTTHA